MLSFLMAAHVDAEAEDSAPVKNGRAALDWQKDYVARTIARHVDFHFEAQAAVCFRQADIVWCRWHEVERFAGRLANAIIIPINPPRMSNDAGWEVAFRGASLVLWNRIALPDGAWRPDNETAPLWYYGPNGLRMPAWDLAGTIFDLLTIGEERRSSQRDHLGRSVAAMSPRAGTDRLAVPMVNNSAAVLVEQSMRLVHGNGAMVMPFAKPLTVCLSHDLDQLRGDDMWTMLAGLRRAVSPVRQGRLPSLAALRTLAENLWSPRRYFMDDLLGMIDAEARLGFRSVSYVLCGRRGRYGARTSNRHIREYLLEIASHCEIGMHYNHDTRHNERAFQQQKRQITEMTGQSPSAGRAHYLLMDPRRSFQFWMGQGVKIDESLGYPDAVGYRAGIAGAFRPFDFENGTELPIVCLPLVAMDSAIAAEFGSDYLAGIESMVKHLSVVGGTFTLLFHPGMFSSPAHPETAGMYDRLLDLFNSYDAVSMTPAQFLAAERTPTE
jgi:hypothetical protein